MNRKTGGIKFKVEAGKKTRAQALEVLIEEAKTLLDVVRIADVFDLEVDVILRNKRKKK